MNLINIPQLSLKFSQAIAPCKQEPTYLSQLTLASAYPLDAYQQFVVS